MIMMQNKSARLKLDLDLGRRYLAFILKADNDVIYETD